MDESTHQRKKKRGRMRRKKKATKHQSVGILVVSVGAIRLGLDAPRQHDTFP